MCREMWKILIVVSVTVICLNGSAARLTKHRITEREMPIYGGTAFDYDYRVEPRRSHHSKPGLHRNSETTTRRPLINYWRNLVRNVRLSMPTITWNVTNPFTNLFNGGEPNFIETQVNPQYDDYTTSIQKRKRPSHRRRQSNRDKRRRTKPASHSNDYADEVANDDGGDAQIDNTINDYTQTEQAGQVQYLLRPYDTDNVRTPVLLYDPRTDQYYEIQSVRTQLQNAETNKDIGKKEPQPVLTTEDQDEFVEIVGTKTSDTPSTDVKTLPINFSIAESSTHLDNDTKQLLLPVESAPAQPTIDIEAVPAGRNAMLIGKSRNSDLTATAKGKSGNSQNWRTLLYYFIPQYS